MVKKVVTSLVFGITYIIGFITSYFYSPTQNAEHIHINTYSAKLLFHTKNTHNSIHTSPSNMVAPTLMRSNKKKGS